MGARVILAAILLAGCSGASGNNVTPADRTMADDSWMSSGTSSEDLLYISNMWTNEVRVYSWPALKRVGTLKGLSEPEAECVDAAGDVWIVNFGKSQMLEYVHGGTKPIAKLDGVGFYVSGCSVDPATGNLAVTILEKNGSSSGESGGYVEVFKNARGTPQTYTDHAGLLQYPAYCTYDDKGNLFVDGSRDVNPWDAFVFAELPAGGDALSDVTLNQNFNYSGGLQWHKPYVAVGDTRSNAIYQFRIRGAYGYENSTTALDGANDILQYAIVGGKVVGANSTTGSVGIWKFPKGGQGIGTLRVLGNPIGVALSPRS
jgi:hypothetical protein